MGEELTLLRTEIGRLYYYYKHRRCKKLCLHGKAMETGVSYLQLLSGYHKMGCDCMCVFKVLLEHDHREVKGRSSSLLCNKAKLNYLKLWS